MWLVFLQDFNGVSIFQDQMWLGGEDAKIFTDASLGLRVSLMEDGSRATGPRVFLNDLLPGKNLFP